MAWNLVNANVGNHVTANLFRAAKAAISLARAELKEERPKIQKVVFEHLKPPLPGLDVLRLVRKRLREHSGSPWDPPVEAWAERLRLVDSPHLSWCCLKLLLGALTTFFRMHETI